MTKMIELSGAEARDAYLGCPREDGRGFRYSHGRKTRIGADATSARAIEWFVRQLRRGAVLDDVEVWHEGRRGRCGRAWRSRRIAGITP